MKQAAVFAAVFAATGCVWLAVFVLSVSEFQTDASDNWQKCRVTSWGWTEEEARKVFPFPPLQPCTQKRRIIEVREQLAYLTCESGETASYLLAPKEDLSMRSDFLTGWHFYRAPVDISEHCFIYASCSDMKGNVTYDAFVHAPASALELSVQREILAKVRERFGGESAPMKIFIVSLDSVGRNSFFRNFPQTAAHLRSQPETWTHDFQQLNVVGFQSRENVVPLLTGLNYSEFQRLREENEDWEDRSLWQIFKAFGFRTMLGLENHVCDFCQFFGHDIHPSKLFFEFYRTATAVENFQAYDPVAHCIGGRNSHTYLLDFMLSFAETYESFPVFQYAHIHPGHEPTQQVARLADPDVLQFVKEVETRFAEDPWLVVLMSDHGHAYQSLAYYANDDKWAIEYKVPSLFFHFNAAFRQIVDDSALAANRERLVTPVDIYVTLTQIAMANAFPQGSRDVAELGEALAAYNTKSEAFRSVFREEVSASRSCADVNVKAMWCSCMQFIDAVPQAHVLSFLLAEMNQRVRSAPYCRAISISRLQYFKSIIELNTTFHSIEFVPEGDAEVSFYAIVAESARTLSVEAMQRLTPYRETCKQVISLDAFNEVPSPAFCLCEAVNATTWNTTYERLLPFRHLIDLELARENISCTQTCQSIHRICVSEFFSLINTCDYLSDRLDDEHKTASVFPCELSSSAAAPLLETQSVLLNGNWSFSCEAVTATSRRVCPCVWR